MQKDGRDPDTGKVMFCVSVVLGETMQEAQEKKQRLLVAQEANFAPRLAHMSFLSGQDFSKFDLDVPLPEVRTNGSRSALESYTIKSGRPCGRC